MTTSGPERPAPSTELVLAPRSELATAEDNLATLDALMGGYLDDNRPANTIRGYEDDWWIWTQYTQAMGIPETANTAGALAGFVKWLESKPPTPPRPNPARKTKDRRWDPTAPNKPQAPSTIDRRITGVVVGLRARGVPASDDAKDAARNTLNIYRRKLAEAAETRGTGQAAPIRTDNLALIVAKCPDTIVGVRDRAILLVSYQFGARRSETANLLVQDITPHSNGIIVTVRAGKTGGRRVPIRRARTGSRVPCPVEAWQAWLAASGIVDGPAFRRIDRYGNVRAQGLSGDGIGNIIGQAGKRAGIPIHFTGHSIRAGLATEARARNHDARTISRITGHSPTSKVLHDYFREVDEWETAPDDIGF